MKVFNIVLCVVVGLVLFVICGCNKIAEKTGESAVENLVETASGGEVDIDVNGNGMTITGQDGEGSMQFGSNAKLPDGWLDIFPQYPGSTIAMSQTSPGEDTENMSVSMLTKDACEKTVEFYEKKAKAAGYTEIRNMNSKDMINLTLAGDDYILTITSGPTDDENMVTLMLHENKEEVTSDGQSSGSGNEGDSHSDPGHDEEPVDVSDVTTDVKIPNGFPVDVLKPYGKVTFVSTMGDDCILQQETNDSPEQVAKFYDDHFTGRGWTIESTMDFPEGKTHIYLSSGGDAILSVFEEEGMVQIALNYHRKSEK